MEFVRHHRSIQSIVMKANTLGVKMKTAWTEKEDAIIKEYYASVKTGSGLGTKRVAGSVLASMLPGRTRAQVITRANILGYSNPRVEWTEEKLQLLKELYPTQGAKCAKAVGASTTAVAQMAHKLGITFNKPEAKLKKPRIKFAWTSEEDELIRTVYPKSIEDCAAKLPNRNRASIIARAKKLGVTYVGAERIVRCVELNIPYTLTEAAAHFNKTKGAFIHACKVGGCCAGYHWEYVG